jgi:hypothetical protein
MATKLYPVISDFDYVAAYLIMGDAGLMLDAAYPGLPMGMLPFKCLNGEGRIVANDPEISRWVSLMPKEKRKKIVTVDGALQADGMLQATVKIRSFGYEALDTRREKKLTDEKEYVKALATGPEMRVSNYRCANADLIEEPLEEVMDVVWNTNADAADYIYFNPFLFDRWEKNPFRLSERSYPVDFGAPIESTLSVNLKFPAEFVLTETPAMQAHVLAQNGGKFLYNVNQQAGRVSATSVLNLSRPTYSPAEYFSLKELFSRIVQLHGTPFVFVRKKN